MRRTRLGVDEKYRAHLNSLFFCPLTKLPVDEIAHFAIYSVALIFPRCPAPKLSGEGADATKTVTYSRKTRSVTLTICEENIPDDSCPLVVFVNSKSGGKQGAVLLSRFRALLNPLQVWKLGSDFCWLLVCCCVALVRQCAASSVCRGAHVEMDAKIQVPHVDAKNLPFVRGAVLHPTGHVRSTHHPPSFNERIALLRRRSPELSHQRCVI